MTPDGRLRLAQVGAGPEADLYLAACVENRHLAHVLLAEPDPAARERLTRRWGIIKQATGKWRELLADDTVDLFLVAGPPEDRTEVAAAALAAGKHVILDAPPALSLDDFDRLLASCPPGGPRLFVSLPQLMHPAIRRAQQLVAAGEIGDLFFGQVTALVGVAEDAPSPDLWLEVAFHAVSVLQRFLGPAQAAAADRAGGSDRPSAGGAILRHAQGVMSTLTLCQTPGTRTVQERRLVGTQGMLLIRDDPEDELPLLGLRGEEVIPIPVRVPLRVQPWNVSQMVDHFVDCLRTGKEPEVTLDEARAALATVLALRESAGSGRRLTLAGSPR